jgi:hypothetical protein
LKTKTWYDFLGDSSRLLPILTKHAAQRWTERFPNHDLEHEWWIACRTRTTPKLFAELTARLGQTHRKQHKLRRGEVHFRVSETVVFVVDRQVVVTVFALKEE